MSELQYTVLAQNDVKGIEYVKADYDTEPAKGLTHGLQKDAIQNSVGGAISKKFKKWKMSFELLQINGRDALSFTDEGTVGLIGDIITQNEIMVRHEQNILSATDHLSRFRTVFVSGGNSGPGSYGRGKLVFQACSSTFTILCESYRSTDEKYIAFKRTVKNLRLQESQIFEGPRALEFIKKESHDQLHPLTNHGTRITITELTEEKQSNGLTIKESFLAAFDESYKDDDCVLAFDKMIQETWWELILKYNVEILLKVGNREKKVSITEETRKIATIEDKKDGWRVYEKENIPIEHEGEKLSIKQIRFVVAPQDYVLPENYQSFTTQRKRMKIGVLNRNIQPHNQIKKRFTGFITFDEALEEEILIPENLTHYGYKNSTHPIIRKVSTEVRNCLNDFHRKLGLVSENGDGQLSKILNEALKDINDQAKELGLLANTGLGKKKKNFQIILKDFTLPRQPELRVEYDDLFEEAMCVFKNLTSKKHTGEVTISLIQKNNEFIQEIVKRTITILPIEEQEIKIPRFKISQKFYYGSPVILKIELAGVNSTLTRFLWLGVEPENNAKEAQIKLTSLHYELPRENSRRIEVEENITDFSFSFENVTGTSLSTEVSVVIKRRKSDDYRTLLSILNKTETIKPFIDNHYNLGTIGFPKPVFGFFNKEQLKHDNRRCEILITIKAAKDYPKHNIVQGQYLMTPKKIDIFIGIDDPGMSIFKGVSQISDVNEPRRSFYREEVDGYHFIFNSGHPYFKKISISYPELVKDYMKEEMIKSAYNICIKEELYFGIFDEKNAYSNGNFSYAEDIIQEEQKNNLLAIYEDLLGRALHKMYAI